MDVRGDSTDAGLACTAAFTPGCLLLDSAQTGLPQCCGLESLFGGDP